MFEYISAFDFICEIVGKKYKTWLKLEYWIWKSSFMNNLPQQEKIKEQIM